MSQSQTFVYDLEMQSRVMTNEFNKTIRRCRIGKVKPKPLPTKKHALLGPFGWIGRAKSELTPWFIHTACTAR